MREVESLLADVFRSYIERTLNLRDAKLDPAYYYQSLPLCIIDSVFSIGVRYEQVRNVVKHFCDSQGWRRYRNGAAVPLENEQNNVESFIAILSSSSDRTAVFRNRCFSNPGAQRAKRIKKADLALRFAEILRRHGVSTFQSLQCLVHPEQLDSDLSLLPTLKSGIVTRYFRMLAGDDFEVKPDRMIKRFIRAAGIDIGENENARAAELVSHAASDLQKNYPHITPRLLDYAIWDYQRGTTRPQKMRCNHRVAS